MPRLRFRIRNAVLVAVPLGILFSWFLVRPYLAQTHLSTIASPPGVSAIEVPPGFQVQLFAQGLDGPRFLRFGPDGALYVAERGADRTVALTDEDQDGVADRRVLFAEKLQHPHSLVYRHHA